nr:FCD domain-containing protein [Pararoseomonas indoligenes]
MRAAGAARPREEAAAPAAQPILQAPSLTERVAEALRGDILSGRRAPGEALPSEQAMAASYGVSRTVMREAISRLKAENRVSTRQGLGVFVAAEPPPEPFQIDPSSHEDVAEVLQICELRMGFEAEAAALAALRREPADLAEMDAAVAAIGAAVRAGDLAAEVEADIRLHAAISAATHNTYYVSFFNSLHRFLRENITASWRRFAEGEPTAEAEAQDEHRAIRDAIADRDPEAARTAARRHMAHTAERIARLRGGAAGLRDGAIVPRRPARRSKEGA